MPRQSEYGALPPDDHDLVKAFLRDSDFLLLSPASYNTLELGGTQLYNRTLVYNHKRHGQFTFGNRTFDFRMKPRFPRKLSLEFLFVDLLNNLSDFYEDFDGVHNRSDFKDLLSLVAFVLRSDSKDRLRPPEILMPLLGIISGRKFTSLESGFFDCSPVMCAV